MTRSAVAAAVVLGARVPCALTTVAPGGASGGGEGIACCATALDAMARNMAAVTAIPLRNNPHSRSWTLFIYVVLLDPTNTQNGCKRSILFFTFFKIFAQGVFIIATTTLMPTQRSPCSIWPTGIL